MDTVRKSRRLQPNHRRQLRKHRPRMSHLNRQHGSRDSGGSWWKSSAARSADRPLSGDGTNTERSPTGIVRSARAVRRKAKTLVGQSLTGHKTIRVPIKTVSHRRDVLSTGTGWTGGVDRAENDDRLQTSTGVAPCAIESKPHEPINQRRKPRTTEPSRGGLPPRWMRPVVRGLCR